jgi:hypothetical protein
MSNQPKWSTTERKAILVNLWLDIGDRCLLGHKTCAEPSHYIYNDPQVVDVAVPQTVDASYYEGIKAFKRTLKVCKVVKVAIPNSKVARLYDFRAEALIKQWKANDRIDRIAQEREVQKALHRVTSRTKPNAQFDADAFYDNQPLYYLDGLGISGLTLKPFAKVRLASSYIYLFVELEKAIFKGISKNKKRKAIRHSKALPQDINKRISLKCWLAVKHYLSY